MYHVYKEYWDTLKPRSPCLTTKLVDIGNKLVTGFYKGL